MVVACPANWFASPPSLPPKCYASVSRELLDTPTTPSGFPSTAPYASHRGCAELCADANASLACIGSAAENEFLAATIASLHAALHQENERGWLWLGNYRYDGRWHCDAPSPSNFTAWLPSEPARYYEARAGRIPLQCASFDVRRPSSAGTNRSQTAAIYGPGMVFGH